MSILFGKVQKQLFQCDVLHVSRTQIRELGFCFRSARLEFALRVRSWFQVRSFSHLYNSLFISHFLCLELQNLCVLFVEILICEKVSRTQFQVLLYMQFQLYQLLQQFVEEMRITIFCCQFQLFALIFKSRALKSLKFIRRFFLQRTHFSDRENSE